MNETTENQDQDNQTLPTEVLLELNFVPTWAREAPAQKNYTNYEDDRSGRRSDRRDFRHGGKSSPRSSAGPDRRHERRAPDTQRKRHAPGTTGNRDNAESTRFIPPAERPEVNISFVPEQRNLNLIVRKIRSSQRAYPLFDIAGLFMREQSSCLVAVETAANQNNSKNKPVFQCKECRNIFLNHEEAIRHTVNRHIEKFYRKEEITTEQPAGNFPLVARCNLSGTLLGPPNYHGYQERVQEIHKSRFSNMSLDAYQKHIEILRNPEAVAQWKEEISKQIVYRAIKEEDSPAMKKPESERDFLEKHAPHMVKETHRAIINSSVASETENSSLKNLLNRIYAKEQQHPFTMAMALRAAFRHIGLHLFKTKGNATFVTAIKPRALDAEHVVESIETVLNFLNEHPGCTRKDMVSALWPEASDQDITKNLSPLTWLIEKGHVIEFFNGTLAVPLQHGKKKKSS